VINFVIQAWWRDMVATWQAFTAELSYKGISHMANS